MTDTIAASTDRERLNTIIAHEHEAIAAMVADRIVAVIHEAVETRGRCVLGLATGSTPLGIYRELIRRHQAGEVSFKHVVTFNLDEYYPMPADSIHSYHRYMWENFFEHVDIRSEHVHIPDGTVPRSQVRARAKAYEEAIRDAGGIDFQILGLGKTGHIGFNEPGSSARSRTRLVTLDGITRKDAAQDFFGEDNVPREAITMGIATILEAREIALIATGEHKAAIVRRSVEGDPSPEVAATFLQGHPNTSVYLDDAAAAALTRVATPWVLDAVEWTPSMMERATVWLSERVGKAVLKLTGHDYHEYGLSGLITAYGTPGAVNGEAFNRLKDKIRGRSRLPHGQRAVVFSPHPDDDVISMGGMLRKLWENENAVVVAYMTSGNIAVFDEDVRRYLDFADRSAETLGLDRTQVRSERHAAEEHMNAKKPGEMDTRVVRELKRQIRESEALSALRVVGIPERHARFLNLPFYQTGAVRKLPIGEDDVRIVRELLEAERPDLVFVAGDLSDPHGTHRMCKEAIERALRELPDLNPEVWLYRGAWQEWSITEADVLVPLSYEELRAKIRAIYMHESQKDTAPFPGAYDDREFWERVEARNRDTATHADRLGLPEYYAMEAYVVAGGTAAGQ